MNKINNMTFTSNFRTSATMKSQFHNFSLALTEAKEVELAKEFTKRTIEDKDSVLIASKLSSGFGKSIFILKKGLKRTEGEFEGRDWISSVDKLVNIYQKLTAKMKFEEGIEKIVKKSEIKKSQLYAQYQEEIKRLSAEV